MLLCAGCKSSVESCSASLLKVDGKAQLEAVTNFLCNFIWSRAMISIME